MPLISTRGAASAQGFGEFAQAAVAANYIEDVFSCFLYTGNGSTQTITNNIDLSTKGGLVWIKRRDSTSAHTLYDTVRGATNFLRSESTDEQSTSASTLTSFNANGFSLGSDASNFGVNQSGELAVSWTFREQPKFFDIVTYTGNGTAGRTIAHNLGSAPGCIIVKSTSNGATNWAVYHRSLAVTDVLLLNDIGAAFAASYFNSTAPTSTVFSVGSSGTTNGSGLTYVAYLFAHDAGGFGAAGTDNVISCGSFSANNNEVITLGYEPQWLLYQDATGGGNWRIADTMRGLTNLSGANAQTIQQLRPNSNGAEGANSGPVLTSTGFTWNQSGGGNTTIYIAIRRGPMRVPTDATKVFIPIAATNASGTINTTNFPVDMQILTSPAGDNRSVVDRLRSVSANSTAVAYALKTEDSVAENTVNLRSLAWNSTSFQTIAYFNNDSALYFNFRRAPSFFDEVCYTGVGGTASFSHNLGVAPELMFVKCRSVGNGGLVYNKTITASKYLQLFFDGEGNKPASNDTGGFAGVEPTSSVFTVGFYSNVNTSGATYVAYLFATCAGVSKVGSYTGNGTTQTIDCGLTAGARFVLIKRTDATGGWYTYDTARGMTNLTDPYLLLNTQGAQVATLGSVTTVATGFALNAAVLADINVSAGTYIFLAIA